MGVGETVTLSYDVILRPDNASFLSSYPGEGVLVTWEGVIVDQYTVADGLQAQWLTREVTLVGGTGDGSDVLAFSDIGPNFSVGTIIDNVSIFASGHNTVYGGAGNDTISGGNNLDILYGDSESAVMSVPVDITLTPSFDGYGARPIESILLSNLPTGTSFNVGTDLGNGQWLLDTTGGSVESKLVGLTASLPAGHVGDYFTVDALVQDNHPGGMTSLEPFHSVNQFVVSGQIYNDTIHAGDGGSFIYGEAGNDTLYGGAGNDTINGGVGDDFLSGEANDNTLTGGLGKDVFNFNPADLGTGISIITDFTKANLVDPDTIDISQYLANAGYVSGTSNIANFAHIQELSGVTVLSVDPDGVGPSPFTTIAILQGIHTNDLAAVFDGNVNLIITVG